MDLISIVVPVYNVCDYLKICIESIVSQTYTNLEIILVDDGSTDDSGHICDIYSKEDKRIKVIHKKNGGLSDARNAGIDCATGSYVAFIDSDDYIDNHMIELLYNTCIEKDAQISICRRKYVHDNYASSSCRVEGVITYSNMEAFRHYLIEDIDGFVVAWNKLYDIRLFKNSNIRYPFGKIHEDCFTTYKLLLRSNRIAYVNYDGYFYRQRANSIMSNSNGEKEYAIVEAYDQVRNMVYTKFPELKQEAEYRYILANLYLISKINDKDYIKKCRNNIRSVHYRNNQYLIGQRRMRTILFLIFGKNYLKINRFCRMILRIYKRKQYGKYVYYRTEEEKN